MDTVSFLQSFGEYFPSNTPRPLAFQSVCSASRALAERSKAGSRIGKYALAWRQSPRPSVSELASLDYTSTVVVSLRMRANGVYRSVDLREFDDVKDLEKSSWWLRRPVDGRLLPVLLRAKANGVANTRLIPSEIVKEVLCVLNLSNSFSLTGITMEGLQGGVLEELRVSFCGSFEGLPDLSGLPYLRLLDVSGTGVSTLAGVAACTSLAEVNVTMCGMLENVNALGCLPNLRTVLANGVSIDSLAWTARCSALRVLMVSSPELVDLTAVGALTNLRRLGISNSPTKSISWITGCRFLEQLFVGGCKELKDLRPICSLRYLKVLDASLSGVEDVTGISNCQALQEVNFMMTKLKPECIEEIKTMNIDNCEL